jgi:phage shock protein E
MGRHQVVRDLAVNRVRTGRIVQGLGTQLLVGLMLLSAVACGEPPPSPGVSLGPTMRAAELSARIQSGDAPLILDVRSQAEFEGGHIPGAIHIPHDQVAERLGELPDDRTVEIVVHCQSGKRADLAEAVLIEAGYENVRDLDGHWANWSASGLPTE